MQALIIGDIHGCYVELLALLEKAGLSDGDSIIAVGDIVDRGPETPQVLDFFQQTPNARTLMGNHERKHVRGARHEVKLSLSQLSAVSNLEMLTRMPLPGWALCRFTSNSRKL